MPKSAFDVYVQNIIGLCADLAHTMDSSNNLEILKAAGAPLALIELDSTPHIMLSTARNAWQDSELVFVDIETNGAKAQDSDIIEIGALKVKRGKIIDKFESFVYAKAVPENITELTGISAKDLLNAPKPKVALERFRVFLGDSVFVAHNVGFDYNFLDFHFKRYGLFGLLNAKFCTIDLARKTILSPKYALSFLNTFLGINTTISHRAYADALTSYHIFSIATHCFPHKLQSLQDLIDFSKGRL